jgi:membrane-bound lytic murein transglycosylase B
MKNACYKGRMKTWMLYCAALTATIITASAPMSVNARSVDAFVAEMKEKARAQGADEALLDKVFAGFKPNKKVMSADKAQPEDKFKWTKYRNSIVSDYRVQQGRKLYRQHRTLLERVAKDYGVPAKYIVALWGTETSYGKVTGNYSVPRALATMAYEGRREAFFTDEFLTSLKIIQQGHISVEQMQGSWAGAMGQSQFMPSSFMRFAVDYDKDGDKDIWTSLPDVFASIANYLSQSGWKADERWGRQVRLPNGFDVTQENREAFFPLTHWKRQGMVYANGAPLPDADVKAAFMLPGQLEEGAFLIYPNYDVLLKWNFSRLFATAVGLLADEIAAGV